MTRIAVTWRRCSAPSGSKIETARLLNIDKLKVHYLCRRYQIGRD